MAARDWQIYLPRRAWQLAACEATLILAALASGFALRFGHDALLLLQDDGGGLKLGAVCLVCMACMYGYALYDSAVLGNFRMSWARLVQVLGTVALVLALLDWEFPNLNLGWRISFDGLLVSGMALCLTRPLFLFWNRHPRLSDSVLLVGEGGLADKLQRELRRRPELGMTWAGTVETVQAGEMVARLARRSPERGGAPRRLVAALPGGWSAFAPALVRQLRAAGYQLEDGLSFYEQVTGKLPIAELAEQSPRFEAGAHLPTATLRAKRAVDCLIALAGLLLLWPLLLAVAILIRLDSPGPAIFRQRRVGRMGRLFTVYKFRSMRVIADADGKATPAGERDPRCTRVGRWLRRLRLDELPQLFNILRGDMSLVGPRPFVPEQEQTCLQTLPFYAQRWTVPPGATGWAQVNRGYCATLEDNAEKLAYDLFYVKHASLAFDLLILFQTLKIVGLGRGGR